MSDFHAFESPRLGEAVAAWIADRYHQRSPGGENFVDLAERGTAVDHFVGDAEPSVGLP